MTRLRGASSPRLTIALLALAVSACSTQRSALLPSASTMATRSGTITTVVRAAGTNYTIEEMFAPFEANLRGIAPGPDARVWFTGVGAEYVGASSVLGRMMQFPLPAGILADYLIEGPDRNVWLLSAGDSNPAITRMTATGKATVFPIEKKFGGAVDAPIVSAGGFLWFVTVSSQGAYVVRSTTAGRMNGYRLPAGASPEWLAAASDGALWMTDDTANAVRRMSPTGRFTSYPIPTPSAYPIGICQGPNSAMWFLENEANNIASVTNAGSFHEFPIPTPNSGPFSCVSGPDGAVWFTETIGKIGRATTSGSIVELPVSAPSGEPDGITVGSDRNVWFSEEQAAGVVGRVELRQVKNSAPVYSTFTLTLTKPARLGSPETIPLKVQVRDLDGNVIVGTYPTPVHLTTTDRGAARLSTTVLASSTSRVSVAYSGRYTNATIGANADGGGRSISATLLPTTPRNKPLPSPALDVTVGSGASLWMCLRNGSIATRARDGSLRDFNDGDEYQSNCSMVEGPDRDVWFTDYSNGRIGRVTPQGKITFVELGNDSSPSSIASGSDGALWVTEYFPHAIARVTVTGKVTTFGMKTTPNVIVAGPDGNLWFLDFGGNIYKLTTNGTATLVRKHVLNSGLWSIAGGLWFSVAGYPYHLEEMSVDGKIEKDYLEDYRCMPSALTGSTGGTLWYVDDFYSCIVRIGPDGKALVVPTYSKKEGQGYAGMTFGPDGDVWFTQSETNGLGWVDPKDF